MAEQTDAAQQPNDEHEHGEIDARLNDTSNYQACFGCGLRNDVGLKLIFRLEGNEVVTDFTPDVRFQGFPGVVHGGVLATLLDETLSRTATIEGRWMMTGRLEIRYRSAALIGVPLRVTARIISSRSRMVQAEGEIRLADDPSTIIADAKGTFLPLPNGYQQRIVEQRPELASFFEK